MLLVEDIVDTGLTLNRLKGLIHREKPCSLKVCSLRDKPPRRKVPVEVNYLCFTVPDLFVVSYGIDYGEKFRNLIYTGCLEKIGAGE